MAVTKFSSGSSFKNLTKYDDFLAGNAAYNPSSYESIASVTLSSSTGWINLNSIPQTYTSLQVRILGRSSQSATQASSVSMLCNSDQTTSYSSHFMNGNGSSVTAGGASSNNRMDIGYVPTNGYSSNIFGVLIIDIHNYTSTTQNKTIRAFSGFDTNGAGTVSLNSGLWQNTNAVTQLSFSNENNGFDWLAGTTVSLYGIKGA